MSTNRVEKLVYWYLRFNGYLTVENFTVHPNFKRDPEAEADILAVRFPLSAEDPIRFNFERDHNLILTNRIDFIIGEVKSSLCDINPSWEDPDRENIQYALRWFGHFPEKESNMISEAIYRQKVWRSDSVSIRFVCFGSEENQVLKNKYPDLKQILHSDTMNFICRRLTTGCLKLHRENWDGYIKFLSDRVIKSWSPDQLLTWTLAGE
jgi:hypothetical protein